MTALNHRITEVNITQKAMEYGVTELEIYKLVVGLITEYQSYGDNWIVIEPHFTWYDEDAGELAIAGIFEPGEWQAQICICLYDELEQGKLSDFGREILYPRKAAIATTFSLTRLTDIAPRRQ